MRRQQFLILVCLLQMGWVRATWAQTFAPAFSRDQVQTILSLGPWPPAQQPDPTNRVSGQPQAIELGRRLFRDPRMSPVGYIACVTCHQPDRSFTDGKARAHGLADLPRNTPALANLRQQRWYGWGGGSDSLWMASIRPMLDAREFDGNPATVARLFARDPELAACYRTVFGVAPARDRQRTVVNVGKALAAWQETLVTGRTPFDDFRDALARGDAAAAVAYPAAAQRGLKLFVGPAGCATCHQGPNFSDGAFHATSASATDTGRHEDARNLQANSFNLLGRYNDDHGRANARATLRLAVREDMRGQFRTPGLRNVAVTAPYMHDGALDTLRQAVQHSAASLPRPLETQQVDDLLAFLATLTDRHGEKRPWDTAAAVPCP